MGIEGERLEFKEHELIGDPGSVRVRAASGEEYALPPEYERFLALASRGVSLGQIALHGWSSGAPFSFRAIARFVVFCCEKRLLLNKSAYEFCESLRSGFTWRRSIVSEPLVEIELARWGPGRRRQLLAAALALPLAAAGALGALIVVYFFGEAYFSRPTPTSPIVAFSSLGRHGEFWPALFMGLAFASLARSFAGASKFVLTRLASGEAKSLRLVVDLLSVRLECSEASLTQKKSAGEALVAAAALAGLFLAPIGAFALRAGPWTALAAALFTSLAALLETSPFVRGAVADALRYVYNWRLDRDSGRESQGQGDESGAIEAATVTAHVATNVAWIAAAAAFFALPVYDLFAYARDWMKFPGLAAKAAAAVFFGLLALAGAAFVDDIVNALAYGAGSDRLGIRRLWRMRSRRAKDRAFGGALDFKSRGVLESAPLLRQLSPTHRQELIRRSAIVSFRPGEAICRQGEKRRELYVLLSGRASVEARKSAGRRRKIMDLEAGSIFGEVGFFLGQARTADVIALEPSVALEIRRDASSAELDPARSSELRDRIRFLQALASSSFLRDLPGEAHDALAALGEPRAFQAGSVVVREGDAGDECYFIVDGRATASRSGKQASKLGPGDVFGEIALLRLQPKRTATVVADENLLTMDLKGSRLWELMSSNLLLAVEIERLALRRLDRDASSPDFEGGIAAGADGDGATGSGSAAGGARRRA